MSDTTQEISTTDVIEEVDPTETPETAVTTEETPIISSDEVEDTNSDEVGLTLTDEEIQAIVDELSQDISSGQTNEPQFPKTDTDLKDDVTALMIAIEKSEQAVAEVESYKSKVEVIKAGYGNVTTFLGTEIADKIAAGQTDDIPLWFHADKRALVEQHPYIGPLVAKLMAGEEVDLPALVREAAKKISLPSIVTSGVGTAPETPKETPMSNLITGLRARHSI